MGSKLIRLGLFCEEILSLSKQVENQKLLLKYSGTPTAI